MPPTVAAATPAQATLHDIETVAIHIFRRICNTQTTLREGYDMLFLSSLCVCVYIYIYILLPFCYQASFWF
jgi:hypothetical protein